MKKILVVAFILCFASLSYAGERVSLSKNDGSIVIPQSMGTRVVTGQNNNVASGSSVVLGTSTTITSVSITADALNDSYIYIGDSTLTATNGFKVASGNTVTIYTDNLADIYVISDGQTNEDFSKISYIAEIQ